MTQQHIGTDSNGRDITRTTYGTVAVWDGSGWAQPAYSDAQLAAIGRLTVDMLASAQQSVLTQHAASAHRAAIVAGIMAAQPRITQFAGYASVSAYTDAQHPMSEHIAS